MSEFHICLARLFIFEPQVHVRDLGMPKKAKDKLTQPPPRERRLRNTGYTVAGYPHAFFGVPTILHSKRMELQGGTWREQQEDCGGLMKLARIWVNDLPEGYEVVLGMLCQDCGYSDAIRIPYVGHKQIFNSTSKRTWGLHEAKPH